MTTPSPRRFPRLVETIGEDAPLQSGVASSVAPEAPEPSPYLAGEVVGDRYRLVREIGRGGMGVVWVAHSLVLGVDVALKLIRASAASSALSSRMAREAHAAARLGHPALVRVFDFGWTRHGDPYLVMELVQGETLAAQLKREARMPAIRAVQTLLPIVDGLRVAHEKGIVHRDIKPDNVFLAADALGRRQPKLLDFGIAKVDKQVDGRLTQMGAVLGSPDYMSPEQALGLDDIDERTDIWSLCVVLYEVITGTVPFQKPNYNALMHAIINEDPISSVDCGAGDKSLWQVIQRGLRKERKDRFQTVTDLGEALALWLYEHGIKEDLSGNSIRAVWLDTALSIGGHEQYSARPGYDSGPAMLSALSKSPTMPAPSASSAETQMTRATRGARRRNRALYIGLPLFALVLGAAGAWLAVSWQRAASAGVAPSPLGAAATAPALPAAAPATAAPAPLEALPVVASAAVKAAGAAAPKSLTLLPFAKRGTILGSKRAVRTALLVLTLGLGLCTQAARADEADASTRMAARELAVSGAEAFDKRDFTTALDHFQRAESLYKVPSIAIMVARCFASVGRVVEAVDKYEETLRMPLDAAAPEAFQRAVADAGVEVEAVRARVARLELRLPADVPAGVAVTLDQRPVPAALLGVPTPVDPGPHHVAARAPGRIAYSYDVTLPEGGRQTVEITLAPLEAAASHGKTESPAVVDTPSRHRGPSTLTVALLAGGGVAIAAGAVTGIAALSHKSSLDAACTPGCPPRMSSDLDSFRLERTLSYLGFGLGLAAAGAGTYLLLHERSSGGQVGALVLPGGAAITGSF